MIWWLATKALSTVLWFAVGVGIGVASVLWGGR